MTRLRVSKPGGSGAAVHWTALVIERCGFDRDAGLLIELVELDQDAGTAALRSGEIPVMRRGPDETIVRAAAGEPYALVAGLLVKPPLWLFARPEVATVAALRGGTIAGISARFGSSLNLRVLLADAGVAAGEVRMLDAGGSLQRLAAVRDGRADATLLSPNAKQRAEDAGLRVLAALPEHQPAFLFSALQVNAPFAARERGAVVALLAAELRAQRWLTDPANRDAAVAMLADADRIDAALAARCYDDLVGAGAYARDGALDGPPFAALIAALRRFGDVSAEFDPASAVDASYLAAAREAARARANPGG